MITGTVIDPAAPRAAPGAPQVRYGPALRDAILASFRGSLRPVAIRGGYRIGLAAVATLMVLLPLIYVGLILAAGWGVYLHATRNLWLFESLRPKMAVLAYGAPLFAGVVLVFFMVKPLLAPRGQRPPIRSLRREDEPLLFSFVERVAAAVGAPAPRRIDVDCQVNASASFRRGLLSMAGNDLVLTVGLPLVHGLSLAQLAGVLAHEFGHFAQGAALRLSYVIRSINWWFVRVVYERDRWDEKLTASQTEARHLFVKATVGAAQLAVWLTRKILAGLMWLGHTASCYLLREMEYDADRYEARLVGAEVFTSTVFELGRLSVANGGALDDVGTFWRDGRLPDDLPGLVALNRRQLPPEVIAKVDAQVRTGTTGRFDTHPADPDRIASARRERDVPVFTSDLPARALFRDLAAAGRGASLDFYRAQVGERVGQAKVQSVAELAGRKQAEDEERAAVGRFFQAVANPLRPLPLAEEVAPAADAAAAVAELRAARAALAARSAELADAWRRYDDADTVLLLCAQARALLALGYRPDRERLGVDGAEATAQREAAAKREVVGRGSVLAAGEALCAQRLAAALSLAGASDEAWAAEVTREAPALLAAVRAVGGQLGRLTAIRDQRAVLATLAAQAAGQAAGEGGEALHRTLSDGFALLGEWRKDLGEQLASVSYPFDHAGGTLSVAAFAIPPLAPDAGPGALFETTGDALGRLYDVYFRALGRLAVFAERVEAAAGLDPLPGPPPAEPVASEA